jgi:hypothetical protein
MPTEWNSDHDVLLKTISKHCLTQSSLHRRSSRYYEKLNKLFGAPLLVLGSVTTSTIFTAIDYEYINYITGSLTLAMTILTSLNSWLDYGDRSALHKTTSNSYEELYMDIEEQLAFYPSNRRLVGEYMKYVRNTFMSKRKSSPNIPLHIIPKPHPLPTTSIRGVKYLSSYTEDEYDITHMGNEMVSLVGDGSV